MLDYPTVERSDFTLPSQRQIVSSQPVPQGWFACYVGDIEEGKNDGIKQASIICFPIILWVTVRFQEGAQEFEEIRHFVAEPDGAILDYLDISYPFLCVVDPSNDFERVAKTALADYQTDKDTNEDNKLVS